MINLEKFGANFISSPEFHFIIWRIMDENLDKSLHKYVTHEYCGYLSFFNNGLLSHRKNLNQYQVWNDKGRLTNEFGW